MSARKVGPDFHLVQLTPEGITLANGHPLRISNGRTSVLFTPGGEPVKIARFEWDMLLRDHRSHQGHQLAEIVTEKVVEETAAAQPEVSQSAATDESEEKD